MGVVCVDHYAFLLMNLRRTRSPCTKCQRCEGLLRGSLACGPIDPPTCSSRSESAQEVRDPRTRMRLSSREPLLPLEECEASHQASSQRQRDPETDGKVALVRQKSDGPVRVTHGHQTKK